MKPIKLGELKYLNSGIKINNISGLARAFVERGVAVVDSPLRFTVVHNKKAWHISGVPRHDLTLENWNVSEIAYTIPKKNLPKDI